MSDGSGQALYVLHIAVLGYWLGSELVINSTYRYVCHAPAMPFAERDRLMSHVMHVDQHVRYALVLQAALGTALLVLRGYLPGGDALVWGALAAGVLWLGFVEAVHRLRLGPAGASLARIDRGSRYILLAFLVAVAVGAFGAASALPLWLRWKIAAFAGVIACGVGIRFALVAHFRTWAEMRTSGATPEREVTIRRTYWRATGVLLLLWVFIGVIVLLSVAKPA